MPSFGDLIDLVVDEMAKEGSNLPGNAGREWGRIHKDIETTRFKRYRLEEMEKEKARREAQSKEMEAQNTDSSSNIAGKVFAGGAVLALGYLAKKMLSDSDSDKMKSDIKKDC